MRISSKSAFVLAAILALAGCASSQLGFDRATGTIASETRIYRNVRGYKIVCDRGMDYCLQRAEAICGGRSYKIAGWPAVSPRVQALVNMQIVTVNTDNSKIIYIVCG